MQQHLDRLYLAELSVYLRNVSRTPDLFQKKVESRRQASFGDFETSDNQALPEEANNTADATSTLVDWQTSR